jgi:DNA-binding GntR family transcriptional regulator
MQCAAGRILVKVTPELERPVPLYMQVVRQIRAQIASGELAEGERIPSQREMMRHWRISMQTASKVIGALKTEGLAIPSVGRDTIVAPSAAARIAAAAAGTAHAPAEAAPPPGLDVKATASRAAAPAHVAKTLGIPSGWRALRRQETRLEAGQAVSVTTMWFPPAIAEKAPRLTESQPLPAGVLAYISEATGERSARVLEENAALAADADIAKALDVPPGSPVLVTRTQHRAADGDLIAYMEAAAPAGRWHVRVYTATAT